MRNEEQIIKWYKEGKTYKELIALSGVSMMTVYNILKKNNIPRDRDIGEKKTPAEIKEILVLYYKEGKTQMQIKEILGASDMTIRKYLHMYKPLIIKHGLEKAIEMIE